MSDCPYYRVHRLRLESREKRSDQQMANVNTISIPWCAHPYSPAPKAQATGAVGGRHLLRCGGLLAKCQVAPDKRGDIERLR
jgi:hypothetical protein